jgi:hypothetical protein
MKERVPNFQISSIKKEMIKPTCAQLNRWKASGHRVKYIRMDNTGKNAALQERSDSSNWKLGIDFEYTAQNPPQQNYLAEQGFAHLANL